MATDKTAMKDEIHVALNEPPSEPDPSVKGPDDEFWSAEARAARGAGPKE